jgi:L-iditol 2-dehydrogenase
LVQDRELELVGSLMYVREDFLAAMRLVENGRVRVEPFITHRFALEQVGEAFEFIGAHPDEVLKVLVEVS